MICQDFSVYFNTRMSSSKISHTSTQVLSLIRPLLSFYLGVSIPDDLVLPAADDVCRVDPALLAALLPAHLGLAPPGSHQHQGQDWEVPHWTATVYCLLTSELIACCDSVWPHGDSDTLTLGNLSSRKM